MLSFVKILNFEPFFIQSCLVISSLLLIGEDLRLQDDNMLQVGSIGRSRRFWGLPRPPPFWLNLPAQQKHPRPPLTPHRPLCCWPVSEWSSGQPPLDPGGRRGAASCLGKGRGPKPHLVWAATQNIVQCCLQCCVCWNRDVVQTQEGRPTHSPSEVLSYISVVVQMYIRI